MGKRACVLGLALVGARLHRREGQVSRFSKAFLVNYFLLSKK